jgi:serine/threonine protein phosphatase PrpC
VTSLRAGAATDTGLIRRNNQDSVLVTDTVFAVADGMGGHVAGEVASKVAVDALRAELGTHPDATPDDLLAAVHAANDAVYAQSQDDANLRGMGTTLTVAALVEADGEDRIAIANVGDSRAYVFAEGDLTQLTEDHSVAEELVRRGELEPEEVDTHPQRHILTRAMGIQPEVDVDLWEVLPYHGDRILLCSDGLVREVTDDQIAAVLRRLADPTEAAQELVARARANGGSDNISVVVIDVADDGGVALAASEALEPAGVESHAAEKVADADPALSSPLAPVTPISLPAPPRRRRLTLRVLVFVVVLLLLLGGAAFAVDAYANDVYYVTLSSTTTNAGIVGTGQQLLIYRGRPGGLLWFHPKLVLTTGVLSTEVLPSRIPALQSGKQEPSLQAAQTYVQNLKQEAAKAAPVNP